MVVTTNGKKDLGCGWNKKIWAWIESMGVDYGRMRKIQIDIDTSCDVTVQKVVIYNVTLNSESYRYEMIARGANQTPELLAWIKELGVKHSTQLEISLDPGRPVKIRATMFIERELLEKLPDVLHLEPADQNRGGEDGDDSTRQE